MTHLVLYNPVLRNVRSGDVVTLRMLHLNEAGQRHMNLARDGVAAFDVTARVVEL